MENPSATLEQLVAETGWLHRLALALVKDQAVADDLVQDTYLVAAAQAPTDGRPLRPWLARVLWNRVRMRSRSGQRRRAREHAFGELAVTPARPDEIVDRIKLQRMLAGLVLELAAPQRDVLLLHYFEGLTSSQIGARLGISPGTARWRLKQAIDELRDRLEERSPNRAWVAPLVAFSRRAPSIKAAALPKLLLAAFIAIAIFAVMLRSEVRKAESHTAPRAIAHATARPELPMQDDDDPRAARAGIRGPEQVFGAEQRRIEGKVIDEAGQPVEGADVEVDCGYDDDAPKPKQRTGAAGAFAIDIDPHCMYTVIASKGNTRGSDMWMRRFANGAITIRLQRLTRAVIRVLDAETGAPIANAEVSTKWWFSDGMTATTGADGIARLDARLPLRLHVTAAHYVYAVELLDNPNHPMASKDGMGITFDDRVFDVPAEVERDIRMKRGVAVSGTVLGPDGNAVAGASVALAGPAGAAKMGYSTTKTDASGMFEVNVPAAGRYGLTADRRDLTNTGPVSVDVPSAGRANLVAHVVRRGAIHGTVVDLGYKPVAAARVSLSEGAIRPVVTDAKGRFTIENVEGTVDLIAHSGSQASAFQHVDVGHPAEVVLQVGPTGISGIAVNHDGSPVAGAEVWLNYCCDTNPSLVHGTGVTTDASGKFSFDVPRGDFLLSVKRDADDDYEEEDDRKVSGGSHDVRLIVP